MIAQYESLQIEFKASFQQQVIKIGIASANAFKALSIIGKYESGMQRIMKCWLKMLKDADKIKLRENSVTGGYFAK